MLLLPIIEGSFRACLKIREDKWICGEDLCLPQHTQAYGEVLIIIQSIYPSTSSLTVIQGYGQINTGVTGESDEREINQVGLDLIMLGFVQTLPNSHPFF